jgi:hypothetical protein
MSKDPSHGCSCLQVSHEACVTGLASVDPWLGYLPRGFYQSYEGARRVCSRRDRPIGDARAGGLRTEIRAPSAAALRKPISARLRRSSDGALTDSVQ